MVTHEHAAQAPDHEDQDDGESVEEPEEPLAAAPAQVSRTAEGPAAVAGHPKSTDGAASRPPQLEGVFSPVEIAFFERAADLYAEEYDVWEDFRRAGLN